MIIFVNHLALSQSDSTRTVDDEKKPLKRTNSFVGTAQFVAPEILKRGAIHVGFVKIVVLIEILFHPYYLF